MDNLYHETITRNVMISFTSKLIELARFISPNSERQFCAQSQSFIDIYDWYQSHKLPLTD